MTFWKRLLGKSDTDIETRASDPSWGALSGISTATGTLVNPRMAENLATVFTCVQVISSAIGSLPAYVYRRIERGREEDTGHPVYRLIRTGPNRWQTWPDFAEWMVCQVLLRGNALVEIVTDNAGRVVEMKPIPWEWVSVQMLPSGRLAYDVTEITTIYGGQGRMRRLLDTEVMHLKDRTDDGLVGKSRLQRAAATVEAGLAVQEFSTAMYMNGANPSGVITTEGKLSRDAGELMRERFEKINTGARNAAKVMILSDGLKWQPMSVTPEDAELLASRRFSTEELARIFNVPPPLAGDYAHNTFTNSETAGRWFAQFTLGPWIAKIEAAFMRSVFSEMDRQTHELVLDLSGFLRGDHAARWAGHEIAVKNGILTPNEVREVEGWNPRPGGDEVANTGAQTKA